MFSVSVDADAAILCIPEHVRHRLRKVFTPSLDGHFLRVGSCQLVQPLGRCTILFRVGSNSHVIIFTLPAHYISDVILGCDFSPTIGGLIDAKTVSCIYRHLASSSRPRVYHALLYVPPIIMSRLAIPPTP